MLVSEVKCWGFKPPWIDVAVIRRPRLACVFDTLSRAYLPRSGLAKACGTALLPAKLGISGTKSARLRNGFA